MYKFTDYARQGANFLNNLARPGHKRLSTLMIYATDLCDSACKHCLIWAKRPVKYLSFDKIKEIMQADCVSSRTTIGLEGGEFLLHPEAMDIMKWLSENHPNFDLLSNCLKPDSTIEAVNKYPPKRLYISLDGTAETYEYMRGKDGYSSVLKVIEQCSKKVPVSVMFTLSPYNDFNDMNHVAGVCKKFGIDMRVGIYNNIHFFDTVEKAHGIDVGAKKDAGGSNGNGNGNGKESFKEVKEKMGLANKLPGDGREYTDSMKLRGDAFKEKIPQSIKQFSENYDFLVLYDEWRQKNLKMRCYSILSSLVILPDGSVPVCQNLDTMLGNVFEQSLDEVFNSASSQKIQHDLVHNCNACWINFHRKYDVVLYRSLEKYFGKGVTSKLFGYYQWEAGKESSYSDVMKKWN